MAMGRFSIIVPTTGAALILRTLAARPGLPHGAAFAEGDYRPLPLSADYRALSGPEGPIARALRRTIPPHELRLSGAPDGGKSWEAPVALAHLLLEQGWTLAGRDEAADILIWATGAVDLDLTLLPGEYALEQKIKQSQDAICGPVPCIAVLPPGPDREAASKMLHALGVKVLTPDRLDAVPARLAEARTGPMQEAAPLTRKKLCFFIGLAAALTAPAAGLVWSGHQLPDTDPAQANAPTPPEDRSPALVSALPSANAPADAVAGQRATGTARQAPSVALFEVRARPGSSCRTALFNPPERILTPVPWAENGFPPTRYGASLCGIALSAGTGAAVPSISPEPPSAFVEAPSHDGARTFFLRGAVQNAVYTFPDPDRGPEAPPLRHSIVSPE